MWGARAPTVKVDIEDDAGMSPEAECVESSSGGQEGPTPQRPRDARSSTGVSAGADALVLGAGEAAAHCAVTCFAPACAYAAAHSPAMDPSYLFAKYHANVGAVANAFEHACSVALLHERTLSSKAKRL